MSTCIYYFSGGGHALSIAKQLARDISGELIPISEIPLKKKFTPQADVIGIIFPVYHATFGMSGMPFFINHYPWILMMKKSGNYSGRSGRKNT